MGAVFRRKIDNHKRHQSSTVYNPLWNIENSLPQYIVSHQGSIGGKILRRTAREFQNVIFGHFVHQTEQELQPPTVFWWQEQQAQLDNFAGSLATRLGEETCATKKYSMKIG